MCAGRTGQAARSTVRTPVRNAAGKAIPGKKTNLVYTADAVRGVEVFEVTLPRS